MPLESQIQTKITTQLEKHGWLVHKIIQSSKNGWVDLEAFRRSFLRMPMPHSGLH